MAGAAAWLSLIDYPVVSITYITMAADVDLHWEQEYTGFEEVFCKDRVFWRAPCHALRDTPLYPVFRRLCELFPDHPCDHNTVFYLFDHVRVSPKTHSIVLRCSHFEHASLEDLRELTSFLEYAAAVIGARGVVLGLLDGFAENLHLRFYDPSDEIAAMVKARASRRPESP